MPLPTITAPAQSSFGDEEYVAAAAVEMVVDDLIEVHRRPPSITYQILWRKKGGKSAGLPVMGKIKKLSGSEKHFADGRDFLIWLAADHCRDAKWTQEQYRAFLYHLLLHADVEYDATTGDETIVARKPDVVAFHDEVREYGLWNRTLTTFNESVRQLPLDLPEE